MVVLGESLRPIAGQMEQRVHKASKGKELLHDVVGFVSQRLRWIDSDTEGLTQGIQEIGAAVAEEAREEDVRQTAARVQTHIEQLLDDYDQVRRAKGGAGDAQGLALLGKVYSASWRRF